MKDMVAYYVIGIDIFCDKPQGLLGCLRKHILINFREVQNG